MRSAGGFVIRRPLREIGRQDFAGFPRLCRGGRQDDSKDRALRDRSVDLDTTGVSLHDALRYRKTETDAGDFSIAWANTLERLEDAVPILFSNAHALVGDLQ